jgi:pimeloyl-ACP methyl ester carboxylesterase
MATITLNGVRLAYDEAGAGPPVVWVHGGFTDRRGADLVVPLLAGRYRVITYDRRGHSQSERVPGRQGVQDHVADLAVLIEQLAAAPAHLVANSDGSEIALKLAVQRPDLVASLCVHEPSLYGVRPHDPRVEDAVQDLKARLDRVIAELERGNNEAAARLLVDDPAVGGPGAWDALPEQARRTFIHNAPTWLDVAHDPTYGIFDLDQLAGITQPVMLTIGGNSDPSAAAVDACLSAALPHARRHTYADAGHLPHRTHAYEFARAVAGFLADVTANADLPGGVRA